MPKLKVLGPALLRLTCDCGEYMHELSKDTDGEVQVDTFRIGTKEPQQPQPKPEESAAPPKKKRSTFFD